MRFTTDAIHRSEDQHTAYGGEPRREEEGDRKRPQPELKDEVLISRAAREALREEEEGPPDRDEDPEP